MNGSVKRIVAPLAIALAVALTALFVAGVVLGAAAYKSGTSLCHECRMDWAKLPAEFSSVELADIGHHVPWFHAIVFIPLLIVAVGPVNRRADRPVSAGELGGAVAALFVAAPLAVFGALGFVFTLLNAFVWHTLTGEFFNEFWPVSEAVFFAFVLATTSLVFAVTFRRLPNSTQQLSRPGFGPAAELP